jgi:hypothetical protein
MTTPTARSAPTSSHPGNSDLTAMSASTPLKGRRWRGADRTLPGSRAPPGDLLQCVGRTAAAIRSTSKLRPIHRQSQVMAVMWRLEAPSATAAVVL